VTHTVFIDGAEGTTGLQIHERFALRRDVETLTIEPEKRKDPARRAELMDAADIVFLCLPDAAAREAVTLVRNDRTRIIDASTAHRTAPGWAYGFPELSATHRESIRTGARVANPGCHASGFIAATYPLVQRGLVSRSDTLCCYSLTGYSGGGKSLIAEYEAGDRDVHHASDRLYALGQSHKHLPEMQAVCGLRHAPVFSPVVGDYFCGMATTLLLPGLDADRVRGVLAEHYADAHFVRVLSPEETGQILYADTMAGTNFMHLAVSGNAERTTVTALFDNLGKGASGAAVQNMNIMLGLDERTGLDPDLV